MKNNTSLIKVCISIIALFSFLTTTAQNPKKSLTTSELCTSWYEWPHESNDGQTTFKTTKYVPVPGIDKQEEPYNFLQFKSDGSCIVTKYCGYCPSLVIEKLNGSYELLYNGNIITSIKISFEQQENTNQINVISIASEKIVLDINQLLKTK